MTAAPEVHRKALVFIGDFSSRAYSAAAPRS